MMQVDPSLSAMGAVRSTIAAQGPLGLYKGMLAPLATVAAFNAVLFSSRGAAERVLSPDGGPLTTGQSIVAGAAAGVPVSLLAAPTELLKCRLQAQTSKPPPGVVFSAEEYRAGRALFRGPGPMLQAIVKYEGPAAMFRGLVPTLLREVPGNAAYFGTYEALKHALAAHQGIPVTQLSSLSLMTAGGIGGAAFWVAVYPMDVIKSRIQTQSAFAADRYRGVLDCGARLYRSGGWASLWRGFGPCFARSIPANSAAFLVYERVKAALT